MTIKSKQNGEAYIEYIFPKPDNLNLHLPKISYGKFHPYWKLVVATGVWVDDVENQVSKIRNQIIIGTLIGMFLALFIAYFMSKSIVNPVIQVRDKLLNMSEGIF